MGRVNSYLVLGSEDSGGKAWARILLRASRGYREADAEWFDGPVWEPGLSPLVAHRSFPYGGRFESVPRIVSQVPKPIVAIVVVRAWWPTTRAQIARERVGGKHAIQVSLDNQRLALGSIYSGLVECKVPTYTVTYEDPRIIAPTLDALGLPSDQEHPWWDGNGWWYEGNDRPMTTEEA